MNIDFLNENFHPKMEEAINHFNNSDWYIAHDVFEEIWHETGGPERQVIQGILQVAVAEIHLENGNINGATILYGEALGRLKRSKLEVLRLDIENLCKCVSKRLEFLQTGKDMSNCSLPVLFLF